MIKIWAFEKIDSSLSVYQKSHRKNCPYLAGRVILDLRSRESSSFLLSNFPTWRNSAKKDIISLVIAPQ